MSYLIKDLPVEEKPREKALLYGFNNLTDAELLAILLRTGTKEKNAKELAIDILNKMQDLKGLTNSKISSLANIKGVGQVKAITILSALELGKRYALKSTKVLPKMKTTDDVYLYFKSYLENELQEKFMAVFLNNQNEVLGHKIMFVGTSTKSLVEPKEVYKEAMLYNALKIVVLHNHPSGNVTPSKEDFLLTDTLKNIGQLLNINLIDHLIIGHGNYFSFYNYLKEGKTNE